MLCNHYKFFLSVINLLFDYILFDIHIDQCIGNTEILVKKLQYLAYTILAIS